MTDRVPDKALNRLAVLAVIPLGLAAGALDGFVLASVSLRRVLRDEHAAEIERAQTLAAEGVRGGIRALSQLDIANAALPLGLAVTATALFAFCLRGATFPKWPRLALTALSLFGVALVLAGLSAYNTFPAPF
jgi:hypothetical protein